MNKILIADGDKREYYIKTESTVRNGFLNINLVLNWFVEKGIISKNIFRRVQG